MQEKAKQIEISGAEKRESEITRDSTRESGLEKLRRLHRPFPPGFVFDRDEANAR
jgi:antitoxin MazE